MTQEEKAKNYDRVSKEVKDFFEGKQKMYSDVTQTLEYLFPELKENENGLTWLTKYIEEEIYCLSMDIRDNEDRMKLENLKKSLAWLEKQGKRGQDPCENCKDRCLNCHNFPCIEKRAFDQGKSVFEVSDGNDTIVQTTIVQQKDLASIEQKPAEWTEEDERIYYSILADIRGRQKSSTSTLEAYYSEQIEWMRLLKERYAWKPSDDQIGAVDWALSLAKNCGEE